MRRSRPLDDVRARSTRVRTLFARVRWNGATPERKKSAREALSGLFAPKR